MLDINLLRTNPELVKENIRKKFQDEKLVMVDEVVEMDKEYRAVIQQADTLRNQIKVASKQIGMLMGKGQKEEAEKAKEQVAVYKADLEGLAAKEDELQAEIRKRMLVIPNIIDPSVPIGRMTARTWKSSASASPSCRISRFRIMWISWSACTASTLTAPAGPPATASITSWAILLACTPRFCPMAVIS